MLKKRFEDTHKKGADQDEDEKDVMGGCDKDDNGSDDDEDDDDDDDLSKSADVAVVSPDEIENFIDSAVERSLVKALSSPQIATILAKALVPEMGISAIRKAINANADQLKEVISHVDDRFDAIDSTNDNISKALSDLSDLSVGELSKSVILGDAAKLNPAPHVNLSKSADGDNVEVLDKPGSAGAQDPKVVTLRKALDLSKMGVMLDGLESANYEFTSHGSISDASYQALQKSLDAHAG